MLPFLTAEAQTEGPAGCHSSVARQNPGLNCIFVYCAEAHAVEEWPVSSSKLSPDGRVVSLSQTLDEPSRTQRLVDLVNLYPSLRSSGWTLASAPPVLGTQSQFETIYNPWPLRIYGFAGSQLNFLSVPTQGELDLDSLLSWMAS